MKLSAAKYLAFLVAVFMPMIASANDFPTTTRVEYVLQCMKNHNGQNYDNFYKCSCVIDEMAKQVPYEEFSQLWTAFQYQRMGGERGAEFRDPPDVKAMAKKFATIQSEAASACFLK